MKKVHRLVKIQKKKKEIEGRLPENKVEGKFIDVSVC